MSQLLFMDGMFGKKSHAYQSKKIWPLGFLFCIIIFLTIQVEAVDLLVSGITTPSEANGTYVPNGEGPLAGFSSWKHATLDYYIYYDDFSGTKYWNIDNDTLDDDVFFYSENNPPSDSPVNVTSWTPYGTGVGSPIIVEAGGALTPEIQLVGNSYNISDGDTGPSFADGTQFGSVATSSGTLTRIFTINNAGAGVLNISGVTFSGVNAADFSVSIVPAASVASTASTTFEITFNPSGDGNRSATVSISNDDADENPYTFDVVGRGFTPRDLVVSGITSPAANGNYIHQGSIYRFEYWKHESENYYLFNDDYGGRYWNIDVDTDDTDTDYLFWKASEDASPVGLTSWTANTVGGIAGSPVISEATPTPDIQLLGNSVVIIDDDTSPSFTDDTHFGSLAVSSGSRTRTFTINNAGSATLTLSGVSPYVTVSGAASTDFTVITPPSATIGASESTTFVVSFDPSAEGSRLATLSISSDDSDESPYSFAVQGEGFTPKNLLVSGITTPSEANGTYVHQGTVYDFQYWKHATSDYYIYNDVFSGTRYWSIDNDLANDVVFFYSNTQGEAPAPVTVAGWHVETGSAGTPLVQYAGPEIAVEGNAVTITDGDTSPSPADHTDFGNIIVSTGTVIRTFTIRNSGGESLSLSGTPVVEISGDSAFSVTTQAASTVAAAGSTTFQVTFNPISPGLKSATISIDNDDSDENPYTFDIQGTGIVPEMDLRQGATAITDGGSHDFGSQALSSDTDVVFTIDNSGAAELTFTTPITIGGANADQFSIQAQPVSPVAASGSTTFTVRFTPTSTGAKTATISIANNDSSENPYDLTITGNGTTAEMDLRQGGASIADGGSHDFGNQSLGANTDVVFTIENSGSSNLTVTTPLSISGTNADQFSIQAQPSSPVAASGTTTFTVRFTPTSTGAKTATISIANNDGDENPYDLTINGTGTAPEMDLLQGATAIADGGSFDFSSRTISTHTDITFTIENNGNLDLSLTTPITISGTNADQFSIQTQPDSSVAVSGTTTFAVRFSPTSAGSKTATLSIANSDGNENPYDLTIQGYGCTSNGTVSNANDDGPGSLRQAIADICPGGTITFSGDVTVLLESTLTIDKNLTIIGAGNRVVLDGQNTVLVFLINPAATVSLDGLTITNGQGPFGGGLLNSGTLLVKNCTFTDNSAGSGGAVYNNMSCVLTVQNCTFSGNVASAAGGGIFNLGGNLTVQNATISGNSAASGGGIYNDGGTLNLYNSIVGNNTADDDIMGGTSIDDHNLTGSVTNLGALADNGGPTQTRALLSGSLAIDAGNNASALATDQRGVTRPQNATSDIGAFELIQPEMSVEGNATAIADGDVSPSTTDHTDFGGADVVGGSISRTFTIRNSGLAELILSGDPIVSISGSNAADFLVTTQPTSPLAGTNGSTTFIVQFDPSATGIRSATLSITNNDVNENPYNFAIQGSGIIAEMDLRQGASAIADGGSHDFGNQTLSSDTDVVFTIENSGTADLTMTTPISIGGANADQFSIQAQPGSPVAASGNTTFTVRFMPTSTGAKTATISIANNDANENPYDLTITGIGIAPEMDLRQGASAIADGGSHDFGNQTLSSDTDVVFTIENSGTANLTMTTPITIGGANADQFSIQAQPGSLVAASGNTTFTVRFTPTSIGNKTATITIANNDANENPYDLTITGTGIAPEMDLRQGASAIADGGSHDFGSQALSSDTDVVFTIENSGTANLTMTTPITIGGANADQFSIQAQPGSLVAASGNTTFTVRFTPTSIGTKTATISMTNNDGNENPYDLVLSGRGIAPEIQIMGNLTEIADGDATPTPADHTNFGDADIAAETVVRTYTIRNTGTDTLNLTGSPVVAITGGDAADFSVTLQPGAEISSLASVTFQVTFNPSTAGVKSASISIGNDDADENPYNFAIQGTGVSAPEMSVTGNGTEITNGDITPSLADHTDFGITMVSSGTLQRMFTIQNSGSAPLILGGSPLVTISGPAATDFNVTTMPSSSIAALNGSTVFQVNFMPTAIGLRQAVISISGNDSDENPYTFAIQGTGIILPSVVTDPAISIGSNGATLNGTVNAKGSRAEVFFEYGQTRNYGRTVTASPATVDGSSNTPVSRVLTGLLAKTLYHYRVVAESGGTWVKGRDHSFITGKSNQSPTVEITSPTDGETVSGLVTIQARATDDVAVERVAFFVDGSELKTTEDGVLTSFEGLDLDLRDGLALALDVEGGLLLLSQDLSWRQLLGPMAGLVGLRTDDTGLIKLQQNGSTEELRLGKREYDRIDFQRSQGRIGRWVLPEMEIGNLKRSGSWLAVDGWLGTERLICLLDSLGGHMNLFKNLPPDTSWCVLSDGSLLVWQGTSCSLWRWLENHWQSYPVEKPAQNLVQVVALPASITQSDPEQYTAEWDTSTTEPGHHTIEAVASDGDGLTSWDSAQVTVQGVKLTLEAFRKSEKLWILRHEYAEITLAIDAAEGTDVSEILLERHTDGLWQSIKELVPSDFKNGIFSYKDNEIMTGRSYRYRARVLNASGETLATSVEIDI